LKALVNRGQGGYEADLTEVPEPAPGASDALVEVRAVGINRGELRLLGARAQGWQPGQDVAGVVVKGAADGSGPEEGARVVAWPEQAGWAQRVAVPTSHLAELASHVSFSEGATLPIAGMTALRLLRLGGELSGQRILITGAAGGVGRFAVEMAARGGASVTAVAGDATRAQGLEDLGATAVVHRLDDLDSPFDLILESAGGPSLEGAVRLVAPGGDILVYGNSSNSPASISFSDFRGRPGARITAFFVYESGSPPTFGEDLKLLAHMVASGALHPEIGMEKGWAEANSVFEALANRRVNGKAVLLVE
jgi:NADPH:quinone reductase